jgi:signal transduction histidine kinase
MAGELAKRMGGASGELKEHLDDIHASADHMRRIIDTFLQINYPDGDATRKRIDLNALAKAVYEQNEPTAQNKQIALKSDYGDALPLAQGDAAHVYQALTNYLANALKFTPPGGRVVVRTLVRGTRLRAEIEDNGPGIKPAERTELFTEFARLSNRPTGGEESTGLGLGIVKQLIGSLQGEVGATFPDAGGSIFWFELPIDRG